MTQYKTGALNRPHKHYSDRRTHTHTHTHTHTQTETHTKYSDHRACTLWSQWSRVDGLWFQQPSSL